MNKSTLVNAIISIVDENTVLKHKLSTLEGKEKSVGNTNDSTPSNRFALMCYQRGLEELTKTLERRLDGEIKKNSDDSYWTYEQWLNNMLDGYSNPFENYDTRYLLKEFSMNELVKELEPWLRQIYKKKAETKRLNDLPKSKEAEQNN